MKVFFCTIALITITNALYSQTFEITAFGARADSRTNNATFIQKAIDHAYSRGGGRVVIPAGYFLTGQIMLKSNVELHLHEDAVLLGSINRLDYADLPSLALIAVRDAKNISITGKGVIDGQGREFIVHLYGLLSQGVVHDTQWKIKRPNENRPMLISMVNCDDITIKNVTLKDASGWVQNYEKCKNVVIDSIRVESTAYWNNDGIDLVDSKNVKIRNCFINATDDGICLKSEDKNDLCENILVENCIVRSSASAFKLGTSSSGGFKNVKVRDLKVYDTFRSAIALEAVDGGTIENIDIRNVVAKNTGNAIFIRLGHRNTDERKGTIRHIYISNVRAEIPLGKPDIGYPVEGPPLKYRHHVFPSSITGLPDNIIEDVLLEDIEITYEGGTDNSIPYFRADSLEKVPENKSCYPEFSMFGELPPWGLYVRHASNVQVKKFTLRTLHNDPRPAIVADHVLNLNLSDFTIQPGDNVPSIILNNVLNHHLENVKLGAGADKGIVINRK